MSTTSIDRKQSPTIQTEQCGGEGEDAPATKTAPAEQSPGEGRKHTNTTTRTVLGPHLSVPAPVKSQQMNFPIDQDLFDSRPPSPPPAQAANEPPYPQADPDSLLPPPDFRPFFTLISDPGTGEHCHPTVHYLFSDDDQEILTSAALHSIEAGSRADAPELQQEGEEHGEEGGEEGEVEERVVIVDIAADGKSVKEVTSLSAAWQALRTEVGAAPSMGDASEEGGERGLMLKISGTEAGNTDLRKEAQQVEDVEGLVRRFGEVLEGLDEVVGREHKDDEAGGGEGLDEGQIGEPV